VAHRPPAPNMAFQRTRRPSLRAGRSIRALGAPLTAYPWGGRPHGRLAHALELGGLTATCMLITGCLQAAQGPIASESSSTSAQSTATPLPTVQSAATPRPQLSVATVDEQGYEVPGATVAVTYQSPQGSRTIFCSAGNRGITVFRGIPAGAVQVLVKVPGFTDFLVPEIRLSSEQTARVTATLKVSWRDSGITNVVPINKMGTPLWSPTPAPTATPIPADMREVRCDPR
jgi:hypothetical protein